MIAYREVFPRDPAPAIGRLYMLVVANAGAARFQAGKAAVIGFVTVIDEALVRKAGRWRVRGLRPKSVKKASLPYVSRLSACGEESRRLGRRRDLCTVLRSG